MVFFCDEEGVSKINFELKAYALIFILFRTLLPANSACFMPEFYHATCPLFPIRLIKTVRLRVPYIEDLLKDPEIGPNLKVIMLVRDPRGVMRSRSAMTWCENPQCSNPEFVCNDLLEDLEAAARLKALYPGSYAKLCVCVCVCVCVYVCVSSKTTRLQVKLR